MSIYQKMYGVSDGTSLTEDQLIDLQKKVRAAQEKVESVTKKTTLMNKARLWSLFISLGFIIGGNYPLYKWLRVEPIDLGFITIQPNIVQFIMITFYALSIVGGIFTYFLWKKAEKAVKERNDLRSFIDENQYVMAVDVQEEQYLLHWKN